MERLPELSTPSHTHTGSSDAHEGPVESTDDATRRQGLGSLSVLPDEMLYYILTFVGKEGFCAFGFASKTCLRLTCDRNLQSLVFARCFPLSDNVERRQGLGYLSGFPDELLGYILTFFGKEDFDAFGLTSKTCLQLTRNKALWPFVFAKSLPRMSRALDVQQREEVMESSCYGRPQYDPLRCVGSVGHSRDHYFYGAIAVDGDKIAAGFWNGVELWNHNTGYKEAMLVSPSYSSITCCAIGDGIVLGGRKSGDLDVWDVNSGRFIKTLRGHALDVIGCAVAGNYIASRGRDRTLRIWDRYGGTCTHVEPTAESYYGCARCACLTVIGDVVVTWGENEVKFGRLSSAIRLFTARASVIRDTQGETFAVRGDTLYVASTARYVLGYSIATGKEDYAQIYKLDSSATCCAVKKDFFATGDHKGAVTVWDVRTGNKLLSWNSGQHTVRACYIRDCSLYTVGMHSGEVRVWNLYTARLEQTLTCPHPILRCFLTGQKIIQQIEAYTDNTDPYLHVWVPTSQPHTQVVSQSPSVFDHSIRAGEHCAIS